MLSLTLKQAIAAADISIMYDQDKKFATFGQF
jgi:hypothetical protein